MHKRILKRFIWPGIALIAVLVVGTVGYWLITQQQYSFLDTFYMTIITISTIGFGEVIDVSAIPAGRIFGVPPFLVPLRMRDFLPSPLIV